MQHSGRFLTGLAVVSMALLSACGDDDAKTSGSKTTEAAGSDNGYGTPKPAGTSASKPEGTTAGAPAPAAGAATIENFAFSVPAKVAAGSTVKVDNKDAATHTFTADNGAFTVQVNAGGSAEFTAPAAGTYAVHCEIHPSMKGELVVG